MVSIDPHLASALHVRRMTRAEFDATDEQGVWQSSSIDALLDGHYDGDLTIGELAAHGDFGIGTVQHLDGELVALDADFYNVTADGVVHPVAPTTRTPFAVVCRFTGDAPVTLTGPLPYDALLAEIDAARARSVHRDEPILAVRVDGSFTHLHLRSVPRQTPPYPPLTEVVTHQTEWTADRVTGTLVGFRFPAQAQGLDVAGFHLHFLSDDRTVGGHVIDGELLDGTLVLDGSSDLHLEVPAGVTVGDADPSALKGAVIRAVEGR